MGMIYKRGDIFWIKYLCWPADPGEHWDDQTERGGTVSEEPRRPQRGRPSPVAPRGPHHL
jgi:hypothetical protein